MTAPAPSVVPGRRRFRPYGAAERMFYSKEKELLLSGPAGTGKSRAELEKIHLCAMKYPGMRALFLRKTRKSLTEAALFTFETKVVQAHHPILRGPTRPFRHNYRYPNGSEIVVGGLDNPDRVMSTEYDMAYVQEAPECTEEDWELVTTRLRNGAMPYQQLLADANPDSPTHWLYQRCQAGRTLLLESRHEDNPTVTATYLATLDALSGVRYQRLRLGLWVAAEGMVYEGWDPAIHRVQRFDIPKDWARYWVVDFGFTHPFVWSAYAQDPDGRLYRYREIYRTQRLVEDHAKEILTVVKRENDPKPSAIICDHDAEDRATLERHLGMETTAAHKSVSDGIQAVASRLKVAGDGKARMFFLRDSLVERDPNLADRKLPCCTEEEPEGYVWNLGGGRRKGEEPVKENDHGLDAARYMVAHLDGLKPYYLPQAFAGPAREVGWPRR